MSESAAQRAVVIGGASGIGWAVAQGLAARGRQVTVADRNADGAAERAADLGAPHDAAGVDVTDEASVAALFDAVGDVDIVVNTAGFGGFGRITELAVEDFRAIVDCCLTGGFIVMKHAGRHLREGGSLVSITSLNARLAAPGMSAYCSAKAGLAMLTQVAALELGPRGIRVNAVSPGFVHTPLTELVTMADGVLEDYIENTPLGRVGVPEDVAEAVLFLCSDEASWLTGEVLDLNGGAHLKRYPDVLAHVDRMASA
ncbi:SDR family oxidoreductase [Mycobacterium crocinum]|uniref:SDR family oxidoreductase n=1 Tax=Mycolicibacterium crocinum TaxID=388459 RepID=A0ABY3TKQ5_9MYCO|nr:SDR family oxidoreductase [Mycolicibacterium crocinum]MCV7215947.1 SDR family oxidoreductase [Mycolicibacterium crocinum]ULN40896.1 SDR family oxidoreductase [Mycolicibacterium crocinum]